MTTLAIILGMVPTALGIALPVPSALHGHCRHRRYLQFHGTESGSGPVAYTLMDDLVNTVSRRLGRPAHDA